MSIFSIPTLLSPILILYPGSFYTTKLKNDSALLLIYLIFLNYQFYFTFLLLVLIFLGGRPSEKNPIPLSCRIDTFL